MQSEAEPAAQQPVIKILKDRLSWSLRDFSGGNSRPQNVNNFAFCLVKTDPAKSTIWLALQKAGLAFNRKQPTELPSPDGQMSRT